MDKFDYLKFKTSMKQDTTKLKISNTKRTDICNKYNQRLCIHKI